TNTDRRVQVGRPALDPPGEARLDWKVICDLATRLGYPMHYRSPEEVFAEFAGLTTNYRGLTYERLGTTGKLWPCPDPDGDGTAVTVRARRGAIRLEARASERMGPGGVFIPFHFREAAANVLTIDELDPDGKIPEFKFCAVRIEP